MALKLSQFQIEKSQFFSGSLITFSSFCLWTLLFFILASILGHFRLANWLVSSAHAILTTYVGFVIVSQTKNDLIHAKCGQFPEVYSFFVAGYFIQDSLALMLIDHLRKKPPFRFLRTTLGWHHLLIVTVALPIIVGKIFFYFRVCFWSKL